MKFTIERDAIRAAMAAIEKVVIRTNTIPILTCVKLEARGSRVTLTATDMESWVSTTLEAQVEQPGATAIDASDFARATNAGATGAQIEVTASGSEAKARVGNARFRFPTLPIEDYPAGRDMAEVDSFTVSAADLPFLFGKCQFAISTEETRYYLNGIHLSVIESKAGIWALRAAATDGFRAAIVDLTASEAAIAAFASLGGGAIIPRQAIANVLRLMPDAGDVTIKIDGHLIDFDFGKMRLVSKLIDASFPDIQRVIPRANPNIATVQREAFGQLVGSLAPFAAIVNAEAKVKARSIKLQFDGSRLELTAGNAAGAQGTDEMQIEGFGQPLQIGFNVKYLQAAIENSVGDQIKIELGGADSPVLMTCPQDSRLRMVVMPMRI